jgi:hypothetical protein
MTGWLFLMGTSSASAQAPSTDYSAAFVAEAQLIVFPFEGGSVKIALPFKPGRLAYSSDGRTVYTNASSASQSRRGLVRISIKSGRISEVPGASDFAPVHSLAISAAEDEIVISGGYRRAGSVECGIFALDVASGKVRPVITQANPGCRYVPAWHDLSLSPDGKQAVGKEGRYSQVKMVDMEGGTYRPIVEGSHPVWSPDGKWIAFVAAPGSAITLIDPNHLSRHRSLGSYDGPTLQWSPDSRYLLLWESESVCAPSFGYFGTFETLDVQSGTRSRIKSSRCEVNLMTGGWVSNGVLR